MKHKLFLFLLLLASIGFLTNCKNLNKKNSTSSIIEVDEFIKIVKNWNEAYNSKDIIKLIDFYDNSILLYGSQLDKNSCIESKLSFFKKNPDYYQQIFGDIQYEKINNLEVKCTFVKRATINQQTKDYPSYLVFSKKENGWKIITEGDLVTDKNLAKRNENKIPKDAIKGDFNGDGNLDFMWLVTPKIDNDGMSCIGDCTSFINFSDATIPKIKIESCIGGVPNNLGDLNNDGSDEIGLLPSWFTSCWRDYYVWTIKNGQWLNAINPIRTHCNQWEEGIKPIEIDKSKTGYVIIRFSEHTGEDIVTKTKSIPIK